MVGNILRGDTSMKRAFICGDLTFPRGGASSNYVQYLGMALSECGYEVHVVTTKNRSFSDSKINGLYIDEYKYSDGKVIRYIEFWLGAEKRIKEILEKYNLNYNDIIVTYTQKAVLAYKLRKLAKRKNAKIGGVVVEWFKKRDITTRRLSWYFAQYKYLMEKEYKRFDFLFPISTYIESRYKDSVPYQLVLPIMADPYEYERVSKNYEGRRFIFPSLGKMKDALNNMVKAAQKILTSQDNRIEVHFCGVRKEAVAEILEIKTSEIDPRMIFHPWMEYDELIRIYNNVHFLLMARSESQMTKANFPSKVPELMTYGVVPLASRVGDYTEYYLQDGYNSVVFDGCEIETIVGAMKKCINLSDEELCSLSNNARKTVEEKFSYKVWLKPIKQFVERIE